MKDVLIAYILWLAGGCGALGLHRFYLGKIPTGILWLCTGGLGMLGSIYDLFTIPAQVRTANLALGAGRQTSYADTIDRSAPRSEQSDTLEQNILMAAKRSRGVVTPSDVALKAGKPLKDVKKELEKLVSDGYAEMRVRKNGAIVYVFPDFMDGSGKDDFEI